MMSAHCPPSSRPARVRLAAAALCAVFMLAAASGCTPLRKRAASTPLSSRSIDGALSAYQSGDCRESIRKFGEALQGQEHPALLNGLGLAYLECNQPQNAAKTFERAVSLAPASAALHTNAGTALYAADDHRGAETHFDAALRIDPGNPEALVGKAGILIEKNQPEQALRQLSQIAGTDAASPEVLYNKALAMYQMGLMSDAETAFGTYTREHPDDPEAQNALGVAMLRAGNYAGAKAHLDRAVALRPEKGA